MREIKLTRGAVALVDDEDFERVNQHKWFLQSRGYAARMKNRKMILMHRFIMNTPVGMETDHKDRVRLNNQKHNLRTCTTAENSHNTVAHAKGSSGYKGVCKCPTTGQWMCRIKTGGKSVWLGRFDKKEDAALRYNKEAVRLHGEFAYQNIIKESQ